MISILIPIYNFAVKELVSELSRQAQELNLDFEILCIDDNSKSKYTELNKDIKKIYGVNYKLNKKNIGRSAIRNLLTKQSKYDYLLFLDCDIKIKENFIKKYIELKDKSDVIVGGVSYNDFKKIDKKKKLRWKYGKLREERKAHFRNQKPYASFSACNLFINKKVSKIISFSETLTKYGHEDTLYGAELELNKFTVIHINNPIIHLGIDEALIFLEKTELALINLISLQKTHPKACRNIKIIKYYKSIRKTLFISKGIFIFCKYLCYSLLKNGNANLVVFDLYKLSFMLCLKED